MSAPWPWLTPLLGAIVLALLLAKWSWLIFAPQPTVTAAKHDITTNPNSEKLFGIAVEAALEPAAQPVITLPNVQLYGVFAHKHQHKKSFAILMLDGKQRGYGIGDEVAPGTTVKAISSDHVILESAGSQQRVNLQSRGATNNIPRQPTPGPHMTEQNIPLPPEN